MRSMRVPALVLGVTLLASACGIAATSVQNADQKASEQNTELITAARNTETMITQQFERAASINLLMAKNPAYAEFFQAKGTNDAKINQDIAPLAEARSQLAYVQTLFPGAVGESCFIDARTGQELARVVNGKPAFPAALSKDESQSAFFGPTTKLPVGFVYQSQPYLSADTNEWVLGNATLIPVDGKKLGLVHFEMRLESLQLLAADQAQNMVIRSVDALTGRVVMDSRSLQVAGSELGDTNDTTFFEPVKTWNSSGIEAVGNDQIAYVRMSPTSKLKSVNENDWYVTASAPKVATGWLVALTPIVLGLLALAIPLLVYAAVSYFRHGRRMRAERERTSVERDHLAARLTDMSDALDRAAAGDLGVSLPVDFEDERLAALATSFDSTLARLRALVSQAQDNGVRLSQASSQLRATAAQQASSATEQSAVVAETTATIEELAATAAQIAETAQGVARVAQDTLLLTDEGRGAVRDSVAAMERITTKVDSIASNTAGLGEKINEVGRILDMIDELSEQTNLLALNAAIEAARAGEHGRGFAVVASEVRKLAERAQQSTAQIQGIVTEIQAHTRSTVMASEEGAREAAHGASLASGAVDALDRIASMVDEATQAVEEISIATQQQRSASDQVVVAMTQVSEVSRQYAAGSKQTSAAAKEISSLAGVMQSSISTFNTDAQAADDSTLADGDFDATELFSHEERAPEPQETSHR
ncbi:MAG: methyl-accepting chemotaxis protein [Actinomycetes bacterium]